MGTSHPLPAAGHCARPCRVAGGTGRAPGPCKAQHRRATACRAAQPSWLVRRAWTVLPMLAVLLAWSSFAPSLIEQVALPSPAAAELPGFRHAARGDPGRSPRGVPAAMRTRCFAPRRAHWWNPSAQPWRSPSIWPDWRCCWPRGWPGAGWPSCACKPDFRARTHVERLVMATLLLASLVAILTTLGIFVPAWCSKPCASSAWFHRWISCSAPSGIPIR